MTIEIEEHKVPETISYSQFNTYIACGWMYYLGRILKLEEEPSVWLTGGSSFHLAAELYDRDNL